MMHAMVRQLFIFFLGVLLCGLLVDGSAAAEKKAQETGKSHGSATVGGKNTSNALGNTKKSAPSSVMISSIEEQEGAVIIVLKRKGKARIDPAIVKQADLEVRIGKKRKTWPLLKIDPKLRMLNSSGGKCVFNTRFILSKPAKVSAVVSGMRPEKKMTAMVHPTPGKEKTAGARQGRPPVKQKGSSTAKADGTSTTVKREHLEVHEPSTPSGGLFFTDPRPGSVHIAGEELRTGFKFVRSSDIGPYQLFLLHDGERLFRFPDTELPPPAETDKFLVPIPKNVQVGDNYQLEALTADGKYTARSLPFIIKRKSPARSDGIRIRISGQPSQISSGETVAVTMTITNPDAAAFSPTLFGQNTYQEFLFYIADHSMPHAGALPSWWLSGAGQGATFAEDNRSVTIQVTLPTDVPAGNNYRFCYFRGNGTDSGESPVFSIVRDDDALTHLTVLTSRTFSQHWFRHSNQDIEWQLDIPQGATIPTHWQIEFLASTQGGVEYTVMSLDSSAAPYESSHENGIITKRYRHPYRVGQFVPGPYHMKISSAGIEGRTVHPIVFEISRLNFELADLRTTEQGQLQVRIVKTPSGSGESAPSSHDAVFSITAGTDPTVYTARTTLTSQEWVSLGHIQEFTSSVPSIEIRAQVRVEMRLADNAPEFDTDDNLVSKYLRIRANALHISLRGQDYVHETNTLYFVGEGYRATDYRLRWFKIHITNNGYAPANGRMFVYQTRNHRPGELAQSGPGPRVDLGSRPSTIPPTYSSSGVNEEGIAVFYSGVSQPDWYIGQIIIEMTGDLDDFNKAPYIHRDGPYIYVNFDYRRLD